MGYYAALKSVYRAVVPEGVRQLTWDHRYPFHHIIAPLKRLLQEHAPHDEVYDRAYFEETVEPLIRRSAPIMAASIRDEFRPGTVVDVGCGTGALLVALRDIGVAGIGLEYSQAAIAIARSKGVEVEMLDLERPLDELLRLRADLCVSTEVAEHLPAAFADTYVSYLCRTADAVLMTAATPGQGGTDHVNEQPHSYWIEKFRGHGFDYEGGLTARLSREWQAAGVVDFYATNLLIFRKAPTAGPLGN
jgi:hypothetical protein